MAPRSVIILCSSCLLAQESHTQWTNAVYLIQRVINYDDNFISTSTSIWEPHNLRRLGLFLFTHEAILVSFQLMLYGFTFAFSNFPHNTNALTVDRLCSLALGWEEQCVYMDIFALGQWVYRSVQERRNSSTLAMEKLQSCTKPPLCAHPSKWNE